MYIKRIAVPLLISGLFGSASAGISPGTGGPIASIAAPPSDQPVPIFASTGIAWNADPAHTRYFDYIYDVSAQPMPGPRPGWSDQYPGAAEAGHPIFKMDVTYPTDGSKIARHEIVPKWEYLVSGVRWYAISVYIPSTWNFSQTPMIVAQLHTAQPIEVTVSPPVRFEIFDHTLRLGLTASTQSPPVKEAASEQIIKLADLTPPSATNKWYCFVARADWSPESGRGTFQLWVNNVLRYTSSNAFNAYVTMKGNYAKTGLYVPGLNNMPASQTIYTDYIYIGDQDAQAEDLQALTPCRHQANSF